MEDLDDLLEDVSDRESFFRFVEALIADREDEVAKEKVSPSSPYGPGANGWENGTIEQYLERSIAWAKDMRDRIPKEPSWRLFAHILYAGKFYE